MVLNLNLTLLIYEDKNPSFIFLPFLIEKKVDLTQGRIRVRAKTFFLEKEERRDLFEKKRGEEIYFERKNRKKAFYSRKKGGGGKEIFQGFLQGIQTNVIVLNEYLKCIEIIIE